MHSVLIDWRAGVVAQQSSGTPSGSEDPAGTPAPKPRPTVSRLRRRARRIAVRAAIWMLCGAAFAAGAVLMLLLIAEGLRSPLTTMKPVAGPACYAPARNV